MTNPRITPYLLYADLDAALLWLADAFSLRVRQRLDGPDGRARHAEMTLGDDGLVMLGSAGADYQNPKRLGHTTQYLYVRVDYGIDEWFARAVNAGAKILEKPADQPYGERRCAVEDPEGHGWYLAQPLPKAK